MAFRRKLSRPIKTLLALGTAGTTVLGLLLFSFFVPMVHDDLVEAARAGDLAAVKRLIWFDADVSRVGYEDHWTPLGAAVMSGNVELVRFLLSKGADANVKDDHGSTTLDIAAGNEEMMHLLAAPGSNGFGAADGNGLMIRAVIFDHAICGNLAGH